MQPSTPAFRRLLATLVPVLFAAGTLFPATVAGQERLCDPSFENCRVPLRDLIAAEQVGIDVAFWFMTDPRYTTDLILKHNQGVPVRVIVDTRANSEYPENADRIRELVEAGIPIRRRTASGILHWKMMLFAGQKTVQFSAANYSSQAFTPREPYRNYTDEAVYFTDKESVVYSFMKKYDDLWTNTSSYTNYANVSGSLQRRYPELSTFPKDPALNFPPAESFRSRSVGRYNAETVQIDATMFRITDRAHTDALINAMSRGVRVRLITDYGQYSNPDRLWHAWNVDRLYMAGAEIRWAGERSSSRPGPSIVGHMGTVHQKSVQLHSQGLTIFGSSNWTSPSSSSQEEHNLFTTEGWIWTWFRDQFERKWNNSTGNVETVAFAPMPPDAPAPTAPAGGATGLGTTVQLEWYGGRWAHVYDIYLGTSSNPPLFAASQELGPSASSSQRQTFTVSGLAEGTTYYWRIVSKTMANLTAAGPVLSFTTAGTPSGGDPPLGAPWSTQDVGAVGVAGAATESGGTFTLRGSGADIWGSADAFRFVYQTLSGDGEIVARVASLEHTHDWAKAGVMIRESLSAGAPNALTAVTAVKGVVFQRRLSAGGTTSHVNSGSGVAPHWVKLVRRGNAIESYRSANGSTWSLIATQTISMPATVLVGLAVTSHDNTRSATATFDNVAVTVTSGSGGSGGTPPGGWTNGDIGAVGVSGSTTESSGTFTLRGSGADIWGTADGFHFARQPLSGDGEIVARVATLQHTDDWAKAGVMIRESLTAGSKNAFVAVTASRGVIFQHRVSTGGTTTHTNSGGGTAPQWVRLVRRGNVFEAHRSADGSSWTLIAAQTISMGSSVYAGLAVTSHDNAVLATATFDNVQIGQSSTPDPGGSTGGASVDLGSVGVAGSASESGGTFTVEGSGADIWGTADAFHYAYQPLAGDGEIVARVASVEYAHRWTKAGVMIREALTAGSRHAYMLVSAGQGLAFQRRVSTGGTSAHTDGGSGAAPHWVRLVRAGNLFEAYQSVDGSSWTLVGSETIAMGSNAYVGLAVTSHDNAVAARATFDNVVVN